jgi:hypothetical protein
VIRSKISQFIATITSIHVRKRIDELEDPFRSRSLHRRIVGTVLFDPELNTALSVSALFISSETGVSGEIIRFLSLSLSLSLSLFFINIRPKWD